MTGLRSTERPSTMSAATFAVLGKSATLLSTFPSTRCPLKFLVYPGEYQHLSPPQPHEMGIM
jgi:hypothetical protein